jgi:hypothetical protein
MEHLLEHNSPFLIYGVHSCFYEFHFEVLDLSYLHEFISINKVGCQSMNVQQISLVSHECFLENGMLGHIDEIS